MESMDVIVIGGGPAGMMAAGRAAELGRRVLLVEKNRALGEKLNLTGGGRCNITNAEFDTRAFLSFFGDSAKFLFSPFSRFAVQDTFEFFSGRGLPLIVEDRKRAFPDTERATDVTRVLTEYMQEQGVEIRYGVEVKHLNMEAGSITGIETTHGSFRAESVVLATGGAAYRETGSTKDAFGWLREAGHSIQEATPDIVPLRVKDTWVKELSGTTLDPMKITFTSKNGDTITQTGKILFTHFGVSGPLILNCAHQVKHLLKQGPLQTTIDLLPGVQINEVDRRILSIFETNKNKMVRNVLKQIAPTGMARALTSHLPEDLSAKKINAVTVDERKSISNALKGLACTVTGTMGYEWAVVCDGGIPLTEVDTRSMASRLHPNLFVVGDLLHISRPSGGYSLQLCWTTGFVAGEHA